MTPRDYAQQAFRAIQMAEALIGERPMPDRDFLTFTVEMGATADHDGETCGQCYYLIVGAEVAAEMLKAGDAGPGAIERLCLEQRRRWERSKFVKLWQEERAAGREPKAAFEARGWEP